MTSRHSFATGVPPSLPDTLGLASHDGGECIGLIFARAALETTQECVEGCPDTGMDPIPRRPANLETNLSGREGGTPGTADIWPTDRQGCPPVMRGCSGLGYAGDRADTPSTDRG